MAIKKNFIGPSKQAPYLSLNEHWLYKSMESGTLTFVYWVTSILHLVLQCICTSVNQCANVVVNFHTTHISYSYVCDRQYHNLTDLIFLWSYNCKFFSVFGRRLSYPIKWHIKCKYRQYKKNKLTTLESKTQSILT